MDRLPCDSCTATAAAEDGAANRYNPKAENQFEEVSPNRLTCKRVALVLAVFLWLVLIVGCALILWIKFPSFQNLKTTTTTTSAVKHKKTIHRQSSNVNNISDVLLNPLATHTDSLRIHWMSNNSFLFLDKADRFMKYTTTTLGNPSDLKTKLFAKRQDLNASDLMFSSDAKFVALLQHQTAFPFNRFLCSIVEITHGTLGKRHNIAIERAEDHGLDVFLWCPQFGSRDFVFVFKNDVYYQSVGAESIKITNSNSEFLFFGSGDWMSREEILDQSIWWSKSGRYIAFAAYDSTSVSKSTVTFRVDREQIDQRIPYAHPGDKNLPIVKIHVWDKVQKTSRVIFPFDLHTESSANFQYLMSAMWGSSSEQGEYLLTIWSNRIQNMISIVICFIDFTCFPFFKFEYAIKGRGFWAEPSTLSLKYATANGFFLILPRVNSDGNVYNNVAYIDISQLEPGNLHYNIRFHDGRFDVEEILGYDAERDELFLSGAGGIGEFHVFRITTASVANDLLPQCVSCSIKNCFHTKTSFSPSSQWLLIACQRPYYFPEVYLKSTSNILDSKLIQNHKHNYHKELSAQLPTLRFEVVPLTHGLDAHVQLILPPLFHPDRLYPVLLSVYGGPSSNAVQKKTPGYLDTLLCVGQGAVVVRIDARGSGQRGWNRRGAVYRQLGGPEVSDQLETIKNLLKRFSFMDKNRIATYGWSYGGFMALHMAQKDQGNMLKCAIAGGSVVDFTYYDSAYVERYMQMPQDNPLGYKATSILNTHTLEAFSKIRLLLVHGEADENVHYSNAAALIRQLQLEGRHFVQLNWKFSSKNGSINGHAKVPGDVYSDLHRNGIISSPYSNDMDVQLRWVSRTQWSYHAILNIKSKIFQYPNIFLEFKGLDTISRVYLDDQLLGRSSNQFRTYSFDVTNKLRSNSTLRLTFESPVRYAKHQFNHYKNRFKVEIPPSCPVDVQNGDCHVNFIRKTQSSFSWDWGPSFPTVGIYKDVNLVYFGALHVHGIHPLVKVKGDKYEFAVTAQPELWYPNGYGEAKLYDLTLIVNYKNLKGWTKKSITTRIGFKNVTLNTNYVDRKKPSFGRNFFFVVNSIPIFLKGANYIPVSVFPSDFSLSTLRFYFHSIVNANMNTIRIWGGGEWPSDEFFELANQNGILVFHDLMFACALYPTNPEFLHNVNQEIEEQILRIRRHPSLLIYSGNNELELGIRGKWWFGFNYSTSTMISDYTKLMSNVLETTKRVDPTTPIIRSSPSNALVNSTVDALPNSPLYGDVHFYNELINLWKINKFPIPRCATEFGVPSFPLRSTMIRYIPETEWSYGSRLMNSRNHHPLGVATLLLMTSEHFEYTDETHTTQIFIVSDRTRIIRGASVRLRMMTLGQKFDPIFSQNITLDIAPLKSTKVNYSDIRRSNAETFFLTADLYDSKGRLISNSLLPFEKLYDTKRFGTATLQSLKHVKPNVFKIAIIATDVVPFVWLDLNMTRILKREKNVKDFHYYFSDNAFYITRSMVEIELYTFDVMNITIELEDIKLCWIYEC